MKQRTSLHPWMVMLAGVAFAVVAPVPARAQSLYAGGAYSWGTLDVTHVDRSLFKDKASAYKVFAGLEFGNFFGAEAAWVNFGSYDAKQLEGLTGSPGSAKLDGWDMAATVRLPLGFPLTLYGKVGYFFWDSTISGPADLFQQLGARAKSGEDPFYGVGLRLNFGRTSLFSEWEHYPRGNDIRSDLVSLGLRFYF